MAAQNLAILNPTFQLRAYKSVKLDLSITFSLNLFQFHITTADLKSNGLLRHLNNNVGLQDGV